MVRRSDRSDLPRRLRVVAASAAVVCAAAMVTGPASAPAQADTASDKAAVDRQIATLRDQLHDTSSDLSEAYVALRRSELAMPAVQARVDEAVSVVAAADQHNDEVATRLAVAQANEERAVAQLATATQEASDAQQRISAFAAQMYQDQGMGQLSVALSATTPDEFASRIAMADTVMDVQSRTITRLSTIRAGATAQKAQIEALREEVAAAKVAAQKALTQAQAARSRAETARQELASLTATQQQQASSVKAKLAGEKSKLAKAESEQKQLQAQLRKIAAAAKRAAARAAAKAAAKAPARPPAPRAGRSSGSTSRSAPSSGGYLSVPSNAPISSEFGMRYHPILHYWRLHAGRDYAASCGSPVRAAANGTIISAGWGGGYGNRIMISHGIQRGVNLVTTYNHMIRFAVRGGTVSRGQVIGYVGTTGSSTGCHLHFETYNDGTPVNPTTWL